MRKSREEAALTRKRIVTTAAAKFRKNGILASGVDELMREAGLTRGGFYKHFESKDQLLAEAYAEAVNTVILERIDAAASEGLGVEAAYLCADHRDNPASGCPLSAIGSELARCDKATREIATDGFLKLVEIVCGQQGGKKPSAAARKRAMVQVCTMIGAITMSRIVTDPKLSSDILKETEKMLTRS